MKLTPLATTYVTSLCLAGAALLAGCSRTDPAAERKSETQPNPGLQKQSQEQQQSIAKAAAQRQKEQEAANTASPKKDMSILTVPPTSPNPNP